MHQTQWSAERPLPPPVSLTSQSHHEKPPEVTCTSRGTPGQPREVRSSIKGQGGLEKPPGSHTGRGGGSAYLLEQHVGVCSSEAAGCLPIKT